MTEPAILVARPTSATVVVALNRPLRRNACNLAMWRELASVFDGLAGDGETRAVILTGNGGTFCAGADISEFEEVRSGAADGLAYEESVDRCYAAIADLPKATIAAISGFCVGGGFGLAQVCDFRVADRTARFGIPAARLGIVYGRRECEGLLSLVGLARAKEILFTGERFDAERAAEIGFVDRLADDALAAAQSFAAEMADSAPLTIAGGKLILNALAGDRGAAEQDRIDEAIKIALESEDYQEGVRAFAERRRPMFRGR